MAQVPFDKIGSLFASSRLSRRQAIQRSAVGAAAAGLAATGVRATAQEATPVDEMAVVTASPKEFLFVQSFESGTIAPKDGVEGAYTVTLQHGLGQTVYFSDRPARIVGSAPTRQFLDGLGFSADNPPNAALVIGSEDGGTDIAVVELTNPTYDEASTTATYDMSVLENYATDVDMQFQEASPDLATIAASFGTAHLFIDDCVDQEVVCQHVEVVDGWQGNIGMRGFCWNWDTWQCEVCTPDVLVEWACNVQFPDQCKAEGSDPCKVVPIDSIAV